MDRTEKQYKSCWASDTMDHFLMDTPTTYRRTASALGMVNYSRWQLYKAMTAGSGIEQAQQTTSEAEQRLKDLRAELEPRITALEDIQERAVMRLCCLYGYTPEQVAKAGLLGVCRARVYRVMQSAENHLAVVG